LLFFYFAKPQKELIEIEISKTQKDQISAGSEKSISTCCPTDRFLLGGLPLLRRESLGSHAGPQIFPGHGQAC
jgi:hypothetical protein